MSNQFDCQSAQYMLDVPSFEAQRQTLMINVCTSEEWEAANLGAAPPPVMVSTHLAFTFLFIVEIALCPACTQ